MAQSLYERLGGELGLRTMVGEIVDAHRANPVIGPRFKASDVATVKERAFEFFAAGSGGPQTYTGLSMPDAHSGMNIDEREFVATCDDVLTVLQAHEIDGATQGEVLGIFFALKPQVLHQ